ncbi:MAG: hypothetical protein IJB16_02720, partial [Clostridia bacterium]|nr:hypothetical protein [Clostridia bacterium]
FFMATAIIGFETVRLNSIENAIECVIETLDLDEAGEAIIDLAASVELPATGSKPSGTYSCGVNSLEFRSNGTVISTFLGLQEKGRFRVSGNEITYSGGMESIGTYDSENNTVTFAGMTYEKD